MPENPETRESARKVHRHTEKSKHELEVSNNFPNPS
jgi:hypothetical protein